MKGYWIILGTSIADQEAHKTYNELWRPIGEAYGARINPQATEILLKEQRNTARVLAVEFPSYEKAKACYEDPAYQDALRFALKASQRDLIIIEGLLA